MHKRFLLIILFLVAGYGCMPRTVRRTSPGGIACRLSEGCSSENRILLTRCCTLAETGHGDEIPAILDGAGVSFSDCPGLVVLAARAYLAADRLEDALILMTADFPETISHEERSGIQSLKQTLEERFRDRISRLRDDEDSDALLQTTTQFNRFFPFDATIFATEMELRLKKSDIETVIRRIRDLPESKMNERLTMDLAHALEAGGQLEDAAELLKNAVENGGGEGLRGEFERLQSRMASGDIAEDIKEMENSPWLNRSDLAVYLTRRFDLSSSVSRSPIIVDISEQADTTAIDTVVSAGIMMLDRNRRFRPEKPVRKMDLAVYLARIAQLFSLPVATSESLPGDVSPSHTAAGSIRECLYMGWLERESDGMFHGSRTVTGREIVRAVEMLHDRIDQVRSGVMTGNP